ncbi:hypothetical protein HEB94_000857 [Actinopolymorpha pittospori]|uniref:Uncharacterized protein n=1 Tax=Actinopolymorpha pittospori TaxID=648752 RepID=A0A927R7A0_9ACTN|nr:hypothetical protein [Actinopolymorpha pittospori]
MVDRHRPRTRAVTQARRVDQIEHMTRDLIAVWLEVDYDTVAVDVNVQIPCRWQEEFRVVEQAQAEAVAAAEAAPRQMRLRVPPPHPRPHRPGRRLPARCVAAVGVAASTGLPRFRSAPPTQGVLTPDALHPALLRRAPRSRRPEALPPVG